MTKDPEKQEQIGYQTWEATVKCLVCGETFISQASDENQELADLTVCTINVHYDNMYAWYLISDSMKKKIRF